MAILCCLGVLPTVHSRQRHLNVAAKMPCEIDAQSWSELYTSETLSDECLPKLQSLLSSPSEIDVARSLQGTEASALINFLDRALAQLHLNDKHRQRCLRLLSKMSKAQGIIPASYILQEELLCVENGKRRRGGFSEVSEGKYLEHAVAIKDLRPNGTGSNRNFERFCREIIGWKHISHPNILPLLGVSVSKELHQFRILSAWMHNETLNQYTRSNPEANRLRLLSEVASGVAYLHGLKIVHGDLKGANIFVDGTGTARIGDFGFMTMGDLGTTVFSESVGSLGGTLHWMSPELLKSVGPGSGIRPTRESDCYALGMVVYEILTGLQPFHNLGYCQLMCTVTSGKKLQKPLAAESLGLSDELWKLLRLCWSKSTSARPTAERLFDHLSHASLTWVSPPQCPVTNPETDRDPSSSSWTFPANPTNRAGTRNWATRFVTLFLDSLSSCMPW